MVDIATSSADSQTMGNTVSRTVHSAAPWLATVAMCVARTAAFAAQHAGAGRRLNPSPSQRHPVPAQRHLGSPHAHHSAEHLRCRWCARWPQGSPWAARAAVDGNLPCRRSPGSGSFTSNLAGNLVGLYLLFRAYTALKYLRYLNHVSFLGAHSG